MRIVPIYQKEANAFVKQHHRHHKPVVGSIFQIGLANDEGKLVGCVIVGRPVARRLDNKRTVEVVRLCTDGSKNACSMLYAAAWRVAKNLGYERLITYILNTEPGTSLRAAGWKCLGEKGGGNWNVPSRPRTNTVLTQSKLLFEIAI